jgi:hypothetical protein
LHLLNFSGLEFSQCPQIEKTDSNFLDNEEVNLLLVSSVLPIRLAILEDNSKIHQGPCLWQARVFKGGQLHQFISEKFLHLLIFSGQEFAQRLYIERTHSNLLGIEESNFCPAPRFLPEDTSQAHEGPGLLQGLVLKGSQVHQFISEKVPTSP